MLVGSRAGTPAATGTAAELGSPAELVGKKLKAAKRKIRAAGCKVGEVQRPKIKGRRVLVVKSSNPGAGATPANGKVNLTLGPKHQK